MMITRKNKIEFGFIGLVTLIIASIVVSIEFGMRKNVGIFITAYSIMLITMFILIRYIFEYYVYKKYVKSHKQ